MINAASSYAMLYTNSISASSSLSSEQMLLSQLDSTQTQGSDNSAAYSLNLSDSALNALNGFDSTGSDDSSDSIISALSYSNYSSGSSSDSNGLDSLLGLGGSDESFANPLGLSDPIAPTSLDGSSFAAATEADGGPLPAFLAYVDKAMNLSGSQAQSLENIANENMNANYTTADISTIAGELQQAGIPETI